MVSQSPSLGRQSESRPVSRSETHRVPDPWVLGVGISGTPHASPPWSSQGRETLAERWGDPSGWAEGQGWLIPQTAQPGVPSRRAVGTLGSQPRPQPLASRPCSRPLPPVFSGQVSSGGDPALCQMGYVGSLGGAADGGCGYGWPELGPAVGGGAPGVLGKWGLLSAWQSVFPGPEGTCQFPLAEWEPG